MARAIKTFTREKANGLLTPERAAALRGKIAACMEDVVNDAYEVMKGTKQWNPTQARVFATLLSKTLPDLSASHITHENTERRPEDMSIDELEALIASSLKLADQEETHDSLNPAEPGHQILLPPGTPREGSG
jgi:hypothetical protein